MSSTIEFTQIKLPEFIASSDLSFGQIIVTDYEIDFGPHELELQHRGTIKETGKKEKRPSVGFPKSIAS